MEEKSEIRPEENHSEEYLNAMESLELADYALRFLRYGILIAGKPLRYVRNRADERGQDGIKNIFEKYRHNI